MAWRKRARISPRATTSSAPRSGLDRLREPLLVERVHLPAPGGDAAVDGDARVTV